MSPPSYSREPISWVGWWIMVIAFVIVIGSTIIYGLIAHNIWQEISRW